MKSVSEKSFVGISVIDIKVDYNDFIVLLKYVIINGDFENRFCINYLGVISVV